MKFHEDHTLPENYEVWVFGSNLAGVHGGGAAKVAREQFGARLGIGVGIIGRTYAIPTKNELIDTMSLNEILPYIDQFVQFTHDNPTVDFFVTRVGCGLAGYRDDQVAPLFYGANNANCNFPEEWQDYLLGENASANADVLKRLLQNDEGSNE